jgi:hypothetical protein
LKLIACSSACRRQKAAVHLRIAEIDFNIASSLDFSNNSIARKHEKAQSMWQFDEHSIQKKN